MEASSSQPNSRPVSLPWTHSTRVLFIFGGILPMALAAPFYLIKLLDIQNTAFLFTVMGNASITPFRCFEALAGTTPQFATRNLQSFVVYHMSVAQFNTSSESKQNRDGKPPEESLIKATKEELWQKFWKVARCNLEITIVFSILTAYSYSPFPTRQINSILDLFYWGNLCNNYILAYAVSIFLEAGTMTFGLAISLLSGKSTTSVNDSPLTKSISPSEFWGARWNVQVHALFKRSIYIPLLTQGCSKEFATVMTFLSSGLFHEYVLSVLSMKQVTSARTDILLVPTQYGAHISFFAWNGVILAIESLVRQHRRKNQRDGKEDHRVVRMYCRLPQPIQTALVLMTVLPIAHWFTNEYISNGLFPDFAMAFPRIVKM